MTKGKPMKPIKEDCQIPTNRNPHSGSIIHSSRQHKDYAGMMRFWKNHKLKGNCNLQYHCSSPFTIKLVNYSINHLDHMKRSINKITFTAISIFASVTRAFAEISAPDTM